MHFDILTAMLVTSALTLAVGASLAVAVSRYPDRLRHAMHIWIGGLLLQIPVFLGFGLVGALPGVATVVIANFLFACAYAEMGRAVRVFASGDARASRSLFFLMGAALPLIGTIGFLLMCNDRMNEELSRLAMRDPLTGVFNRRTFEERAVRVIADAARGVAPLSLLAVDLDHFKHVNDELGHAGGDEALKLVVALMQEVLAEGQILCRIGGEEFAVLLPGADEDDASEVAERLRRHLERSPVHVEGRLLYLRISVGVATFGASHETLPTLLKAADRALYAAKRAGRNRVTTSASLAETG